MKFNVLTLTLNNFLGAFAGGYGRMSGAANGLLAALGAIDLTLLGLWWALDGGERLSHVFKKLLYLGFWVWAVRSFPSIANSFVQTLIQAGTLAGGGANSNILLDPSAVAAHGLDATSPLAQKLSDLGITDLSRIFILSIPYLLIILCFFVMAINCFLTVLEYYLIVALVGIFLPFALFQSTKFLAEKAIGAVVSVGMKLMTLAFVMAVVEPTLGQIHFAGDDIALNEIFAVLLTTAGCTFLAWQAPRLASSLMAGSPHLGVGEAAAAVGATAGAVTMLLSNRFFRNQTASDSSSPSAAGSSSASSASSTFGVQDRAKGSLPSLGGADAGNAEAARKASPSLVRSIAPSSESPNA